MRICDPTFESAGMLIFAADYVAERGGDRYNLVLEGQERNLGTYAIGKLNMLLHGPASARLVPGDVIAEPGLVDQQGRLQSYDRVIANPPFSMKNWGHNFAPSDPHYRFDRYGAIPPRTRGDLAFLLHMLGVTNAEGMVGVVMPHGVLFRGGAEGKIRKGIVDADLFEAIIGLAPNLFFGASIPVSICVLNKVKPAERRPKSLFGIDKGRLKITGDIISPIDVEWETQSRPGPGAQPMILLDTHAALWLRAGAARLGPVARAEIERP